MALTSPGPLSTHKFASGLSVQWRVVHALIIRDALRKHGHNGLGFFWIIGEPLALMTGITVIWSVLHITHSSEVEVIPFALTGYSFITLWRHISGQAARIMGENVLLIYHRHVVFLDVIIAKALLETLALFAALIIPYIPLALLGYCPPLSDPLLLVAGYVFTGWFSFGIGMIIAGLSEIFEWVHNVIAAVMYITLPLTGAFTMQEWMPDHLQKILAWSPLVNCIEMLRGGMFGTAVPVHFDFPFTVMCCSIATMIGLLLCQQAQKHINA